MNSFRAKKVETVKEIKDLLTNSSSLAIAEYRGLTVAELEQLRNEFRAAGVVTKVYKNRLFKIAAKEAGFSSIETELIGPNIFAFGTSDPIAPAKIIFNSTKEQPLLILKGGIYEGQVISSSEMKDVATLPNFTEALTILARSLQTPLQQLSLGLKMLVDEGKINQ